MGDDQAYEEDKDVANVSHDSSRSERPRVYRGPEKLRKTDFYRFSLLRRRFKLEEFFLFEVEL